MKVRIISGRYGGRTINTPTRRSTHVMGDYVRSALFNMLGDISGLNILDAFAGSGAIGLEAISRGASHVTFIEKNYAATQIIAENATTLGVTNQVKITKSTVLNWASTTNQPSFDLIFADPPYNDLQINSLSALAKFLSPKGSLILSLPAKAESPQLENLTLTDRRNYGDANLAFYIKNI